jgi:Lar family restriction alleviation protein
MRKEEGMAARSQPSADAKDALALLPCPFCGGAAKLARIISPEGEARGEKPSWDAECQECGTWRRFDSEAQAITAWNSRDYPQPSVREATAGGDWVLVPRVPTIEMEAAGAEMYGETEGFDPPQRMGLVYGGMVFAAPNPPAESKPPGSAGEAEVSTLHGMNTSTPPVSQ